MSAIEAREATNAKRRMLVVEDNADLREQLKFILEKRLAVSVDTARDGDEASRILAQRAYSILLTDLRMPRVGGMKLIEEIEKRKLPVTVIVTTGHGSIDEAVQAMRMGATDFLTKPVDMDHLCRLIKRALHERDLQDEVQSLREQLQERHSFQNILSKSPRMHAVFEMINHVARSNTTVLIEGETGTGKEQVARAIHQSSEQAANPFVAINCLLRTGDQKSAVAFIADWNDGDP